jgi:hypothetical protein
MGSESRFKGGHTRVGEGLHAEGVIVGPKERERRLTERRVDRSHRRRGGIRGRRGARLWTREKMAELVLSLTFLFASAILVVVPFVLPTWIPETSERPHPTWEVFSSRP